MAGTLKKITIDGHVYFISTDIPPSLDEYSILDSFKVTLLDGNQVFSGTISEEDITTMSSLVEMDKDVFYGTFRKSLCSSERTSGLFSYHLKEDMNSVTTLLLKQVLDENMKFQLGSISMTKEDEPGNSILHLLGSLSKQMEELKNRVSSLCDKNDSLEGEKKDMTERMESYVADKEVFENDLFAKFSLVLNEKKARIRELKSKDGSTTKHEEKPKEKQKIKKDSDEDVDTDEEKEELLKTKRNKETVKSTIPKKNKRKIMNKNLGIIFDDSLDEDEEDNSPQLNRKRSKITKPKAVVQPVLPRNNNLISSLSTTTQPVEPKRSPPQSQPDTLPVIKKEPKSIDTQEKDLLDELMF